MKNNKIKPASLVVIVVFLAIIYVGMILHVALPDREVSSSERRLLAQFPFPTLEDVFDSAYSGTFDEYMLDQFPFRDFFRSLKATTNQALGRADNNGYVIEDGKIFKLETKTDVKQISYAAGRFNTMTETFLAAESGSGYDVYYTIIPDKSYYSEGSFPKLDYELLWQTMDENMEYGEYIDITDTLTADSYYDTDTHWKQQAIVPTAEILLSAMGTDPSVSADWTQSTLGVFDGVYKAHSGYAMDADELVVMEHPLMQNAVVLNHETGEEEPFYIVEELESMDGYNVFLGGPASLLEITNPDALTDRELVIFRDSFGSSLTPLFVPYYSRIIVVDIRYITPSIIGDFVEFSGEGDAIFAYSTMMLNSGRVLR